MNFEVKTIAELERWLYDFVLPAAASRDEPIPIARTEKLARAVCNPHNTLRVIHVAGTSGKGSTCYAIASRLLAAGAKIGMTISPHIFSITERVQIDGAPLADEKFIAYFNEFFALVQSGETVIPIFAPAASSRDAIA
jgi:dihydrofolate synthase/folylpolyglutamate synthase